MPTRKKTGDPVDDLPAASRKTLESAPPDGRWRIPYTVARLFVARGWGEHLGKSGSTKGAMPTSLFQLNAQGLEAVETARGRSREGLDRITYAAVHEATTSEISGLLEDYSLEQLIRSAEQLVERVQTAGNSAAGARGYLDALTAYRDKQASVTA